MSIRRKKGDIVAITVSFIIAMFLAAALIYGSEFRRRKDLEDLHEQALKSAELNVTITPEKEKTSISTREEPNPNPTRPCYEDAKKTLNETDSFTDSIRSMPSDPNTPLLTPNYDDDPVNEKEVYAVNRERRDKEPIGPNTEINNIIKETSKNVSKGTDSNSNSTGMKGKIERLPKGENIVPFQPQVKQAQEPSFDVKDEIEAIRQHVLNKTAGKSTINQPKNNIEIKQPPPPPPRSKRQSPSSSNIIFDPVPGLFPKLFVNRFFKKRRVRLIMYGPKNSKKEFVMEGDNGDKLAEKLMGSPAPSEPSNNTPPVASVS